MSGRGVAPRTTGLVTTARATRTDTRMREKLVEAIRIRNAESYDEGYADARKGRAHRDARA